MATATSLAIVGALQAPPALAQQAAPQPSTVPIESVILEYQSLTYSAAGIAGELKKTIDFERNPTAKVVIATAADVAALAQLQAALGQAGLIHTRLSNLTTAIPGNSRFPCVNPQSALSSSASLLNQQENLMAAAPTNAPSPAAPTALLPALLANATPIQTLLQTLTTLATSAAVTEAVAPASGTVNDTTLINLVAGRLPSSRVYTPSAYPPGLLNHTLSGTLIGQTLVLLENARNDVNDAADKKLLTDCQGYDTDPRTGAKTLHNQATITQLTAEIIAANSLVDTYEATLFTGSAAAPSAAAATPTSAAAASPTSPTAGAAAPAAAPAAPTSAAPSAATAAPSAAASPTAGGSPLQQMLSADYLLRALGATVAKPYVDATAQDPVYVVIVHALESGGTTLTKTGVLSGSHIYYSGGAASSFALYRVSERLTDLVTTIDAKGASRTTSFLGAGLCSGVSLGYRGSVFEGRMTDAFNDATTPDAGTTANDGLPTVNHVTTNCPDNRQPPPQKS